ncbi:MAG: NUDIX hydrolase [Calditrichaeota bacterium]|nr:NUDIX hydrolase [Calditrichota bacterium]RQV93518.1 MAG: NUDIX hydrolase [bacterium]RQW06432.1 MAG: NUDIX hydrolase [Calditrichota bacterium]
MVYQYEYPRPMVTVDIVVLRYYDDELQLLLINRKHPPFVNHWALPGGYIQMDETTYEAAQRELQEETSLNTELLFPILVADDPERDPRGRTISHVYCVLLPPPFPEVTAGDDAGGIRWFSLSNLPELAFDHKQVFDRAIEELRFHLTVRLKIIALLDEIFPVKMLFNLLENIGFPPTLGVNTLNRCLKLNILEKTEGDLYRKMIDEDQLFNLGSRTLLQE